MHRYWGAPIGALIFLPWGGWAALLGALLGGGASAWRLRSWQFRLREDPVMQRAFFRLLGHTCKLSGAVSPEHIQGARQLMARWDLSLSHQEAAIRAFNLGKSGIDAASVIARLKRRAESRGFCAYLAIQLIVVARSAYQSLAAEKALGQILRQLGVPSGTLRLKRNPAPQSRPPTARPVQSSPWDVVGVAPGTQGAELKKAYRRAMGRVHPDKVAAAGGTSAQVEAAKIQSQAIQDAWSKIKHYASR